MAEIKYNSPTEGNKIQKKQMKQNTYRHTEEIK